MLMYVVVPLATFCFAALPLPSVFLPNLSCLGAQHGRLVGLDDLVGLPGQEGHLHAVTHLLHRLLATVLGLQVPVIIFILIT